MITNLNYSKPYLTHSFNHMFVDRTLMTFRNLQVHQHKQFMGTYLMRPPVIFIPARLVGGNKLPGHGFKILRSLETPKKTSSMINGLPGASNNTDKPCSENKAPSTLPEASVKEVSTNIQTSFMGDPRYRKSFLHNR